LPRTKIPVAIRITPRIKRFATYRAGLLGKSFAAYVEDLIVADLRDPPEMTKLPSRKR
jgi:hypothetical protein